MRMTWRIIYMVLIILNLRAGLINGYWFNIFAAIAVGTVWFFLERAWRETDEMKRYG